jgi:hypothetical protein
MFFSEIKCTSGFSYEIENARSHINTWLCEDEGCAFEKKGPKSSTVFVVAGKFLHPTKSFNRKILVQKSLARIPELRS